MASSYREYAPAPVLAGIVACYWTSLSTPHRSAPFETRVLPDGCMDILFSTGEQPRREDGIQHSLRAYVVGAMRRAITYTLPPGVGMIGVRFLPGVAPGLLRVRAGELTDAVAPLADFWGSDAGDLLEQLAATPSAGQRVAALDRVVGRRAAAAPAPDPLVREAVALIESSQGSVPLRALHASLRVSPRRLQRSFDEHVGLSPKVACRIARLQVAVNRRRREPALPLARLAAETGYYDQAHLTRDFRELAGITPAALLARRRVASVQDEHDAAV